MSTFGERCADDVRAYLVEHKLKQSQLTGKTMAELIDRRKKFEEQQAAKRKKLATEEEWIKGLEINPLFAQINVRNELAHAQFWCTERSRQCTRAFFANWISKAAKQAVLSPGGPKGPDGAAGGVKSPRGPKNGPPGWLARFRELYPDAPANTAGHQFEIKEENDYEWGRLDRTIRDVLTSLATKKP